MSASYHTSPSLVAFTGRIRHGKTAAGRFLIDQHGFDRVSFADPLKVMLMTLGVTREQLYHQDFKEKPCEKLCGRTPRHAMQTIGTDWGRKMIHPDLWVEAARRQMREQMTQGKKLVIDDLRFDNEAQVVHDLGGVVIKIERPGVDPATAWWQVLVNWLRGSRPHASERGISPALVTATVPNDGSLHQLYDRVREAMTRPNHRPLAA
jgi:hypothetical protein